MPLKLELIRRWYTPFARSAQLIPLGQADLQLWGLRSIQKIRGASLPPRARGDS
jgi:hypothetical protein